MKIVLRKCLTFLYLIFSSLLGWGLLVPLSHVIPKRKGSTLFIEQGRDRFIDNVKYLFICLAEEGRNCCYLTRGLFTARQLRDLGLPVVEGPFLRAIATLLRAETVVVDGFGLRVGLRFFLCHGSRKIQLWHGFPIKKINLQRYPTAPRLRDRVAKAFWGFTGRYPRYDLLISTSLFCTEKALAGAFRTRQTVDTGYPRNDVFFREPTPKDLLGTDLPAINRLRSLKQAGERLILYAPTFRDSKGDAITDGAIDLARLNQFALKNQLRFVIKSHSNDSDIYSGASYPGLVSYNSSADVYPALPLFDMLVTDYSSIFFDFLLLERPIVFFPYDYDKYISRDRPLIFDYREITPGPVCLDQDHCEVAIVKMLDGDDDYREARSKMLKRAFTFHDGKAAERISAILESG